MLRGTLTIFVLLLLAGILQAAPASETPALRVFVHWLDAFNSGDRAQISAFWHQYGADGPEERIEHDVRLRAMTGGMSIFRVVQDTDKSVVVLMKENRGVWSESNMELTSTNPPVVGRMMGHPVPPPEADSAKAAGNDKELAALVSEHIAAKSGPDAYSGALLIAHRGQIIAENASGLADNQKQIPNNIDTQFCMGSMVKMFTAVSILQLVQQGKIALDKPIATWWPDYPNRDLAARVTIRELLSHTGGTGDIFTPEYKAHRAEVRTVADYVRILGNRPVAFEPGTRMEYSNYGFVLLGRIIELVSGESYENYVRKHVFIPAGMAHTDLHPESDHAQGRAIGYISQSGALVPNSDTMSWNGSPAGGGYSTVRDLFLFAQALQAGTLLRADLLQEAIRAGKLRDDYGLGFYVLPGGGYGHGGGAPGVNGELHILPQRGYVIVALANRDPRAATNLVDFITTVLPEPAAAEGGTW